MYQAVVFLCFYLFSAASACRYDHLPCQLTNGTVVSPDIYSFCCNGNIYPKVLNGRKNCCCKDSLPGGIPQVYNPEEHICCLGGKFPRRDSLGQEQGCCGTKPYPMVRGQLCCVPQPHENHANANLFTSLIGENDTCCGNEKYDSTTQVCCTDGMFKVRLYTKDNNKICCQKDYINKNTHDCIINKETNRLGKTLKFSRSCGDTKIDDRQDLCCNGQAHRNVSQISSHSCCGDEIFNRNTHQCCGNTHTIAINMQCCGSHRDGFNPRTHRCCNGVPVGISKETDQCCGDATIDTKTHHCCNGQAYDKSTFIICRAANKQCSAIKVADKCCGAEKLNQDSVCCKAGTPFNFRYFQTRKKSSSQNRCCTSYKKGSLSAIPYSDQMEECRRGHEPKVTKKLDKPKCGRLYYNQNSDLCCNNYFYHNALSEGKRCCQYDVFNPATQSCCEQGRVYNTTSCGNAWCGRKIYNTEMKLCCDNQLHWKLPGTICCGKKALDPSRQTCCGSEVLTKPNKCRRQEHPICKWLCEQNDKKIRRKIRSGALDICKTNAYVTRVGQKNNVRDVTRLQLEGEKIRLYHHNQYSFKVKKLFHPTCVCDKKPTKKLRRKIVVITDKSIRDIRVDLTDSDYILPYTSKIRKTLMKYWKERCTITPTSLVTADVVDEIFDFIKIKIAKQEKSQFYES